MCREITRAKSPALSESEFLRQAIENLRGVIEFVVYLKGLRIVGNPCRVFDVIDFVAKPLQSDDVMNVLPDYACDRHRAHEAHDDDALAFHDEEDIERQHPGRTSKTERSTFELTLDVRC